MSDTWFHWFETYREINVTIEPKKFYAISLERHFEDVPYYINLKVYSINSNYVHTDQKQNEKPSILHIGSLSPCVNGQAGE